MENPVAESMVDAVTQEAADAAEIVVDSFVIEPHTLQMTINILATLAYGHDVPGYPGTVVGDVIHALRHLGVNIHGRRNGNG